MSGRCVLVALLVVLLCGGEAQAQQGRFLRGDANADGLRDASDAVFALRFLFLGGELPSCEDAADANDDGVLDLSDPIRLLGFLFRSEEIPDPSSSPGEDPTPDNLSCGIITLPLVNALSVTDPAPGAVLSSPAVTIRGTVDPPDARVSIEGIPAVVEAGSFTVEGLALREGFNEFEITARTDDGDEQTQTVSYTRDTVPPGLSILLPVHRSVSDQTAVTVLGTVVDATATTCTVAGGPVVVDSSRFETSLDLPEGANTIAFECQDAAGLSTSRELIVYVDTTPLVVTDVTPLANALGVFRTANVEVAFSEAVDATTLRSNSIFLRAGAEVVSTSVSLSPDGLNATLIPAAPFPAGTLIDVRVTRGVRNTEGVPLFVEFSSQFVTEGKLEEPSVVVGEIYDDSRSLPIPGALIEAIDPTTQQILDTTISDELGRYLLPAGQTSVLLRLSKPGFTTCRRGASVEATSFAEARDARLSPVDAVVTVEPGAGREVLNRVGDGLVVPGGAVTSATEIRFTSVGEQAPTAFFPLGWSPLAIVDIGANRPFDAPATLSLANRFAALAGASSTLARYDELTNRWIALEIQPIPANGPMTFSGIVEATQYALLIPDTGDGAPASVEIGSPLPAGSDFPIPGGAVGDGSVSPSVGRADDPTPARAEVSIQASTPLRSGSPLRGEFMEMFLLRAGGQATPLDTNQDLVAYRADSPDGSLRARFAITPSRTFAPGELETGEVVVRVLRRTLSERSLVSVTGGGIELADGSRVRIPAGAFALDVPVSARRVDADDLGDVAGARALGGLDLDLASAVAGESITLSLAGVAPFVPGGATIVLAQIKDVRGKQSRVFVALGEIDGNSVTTIAEVDGVSLPGVRVSGRYAFFVVESPLALVTGTVRDDVGRRQDHRISVDRDDVTQPPFIALTDSEGRFVALATVGDNTVVAASSITDDEASTSVAVADTLATVALGEELVIGPTAPRVERIIVRPTPVPGFIPGPVVLLGNPAPVIDDDSTGESSGDSDGVPESGERIELSIFVENQGNVAVDDGSVVVLVRAGEVALDVTPPSVEFPSLPSGEPTVVGPFVFDVPAGASATDLGYTFAYVLQDGSSRPFDFVLPVAANHVNAPTDSEVLARFSEPIDASTLESSFRLERIEGEVLSPVASRIVPVQGDAPAFALRPLEPLAHTSRYQVTLTAGVRDVDGRSLDPAPVVETIETIDLTGPPVDAGLIESSIGAEAGTIDVSGSLGTVNPDDVVVILNETSGSSVVATVAADGSFQETIDAQAGDAIVIIVRDRLGRDTEVAVRRLVRKDAGGNVTDVYLGRQGGVVDGAGGLKLDVPAGALPGATALRVEPEASPFELPSDIAADGVLAAAFDALFEPSERVNVGMEGVAQLLAPLGVSLPAPAGAAEGELYAVVREVAVEIGGTLADLDLIEGVPLADNPRTTVTRLEVVDTASVKSEDGELVLSTDSPPFSGVLEPGALTFLRLKAPLSFVAGETRRDSSTGARVEGAVVHGLSGVTPTSAFVAVSRRDGRFVVPASSFGGPHADGTEVSGRLEIDDPRRQRVIRLDVRGQVTEPAPDGVTVVHLDEPIVLPSRLPRSFVPILGDIDPPTVRLEVAGESLDDFVARVGDPLVVTVFAEDDDLVSSLRLQVDGGSGFVPAQLSVDRRFEFTPDTDSVVVFRATARDPTQNETVEELRVRTVAAAPGEPLVPTSLPGRLPERLDSAKSVVSFDSGFGVRFSEPLDPTQIVGNCVTLLDPEGESVEIDVELSENNTMLTVTPRRNLRLGACYTVILEPVITDEDGETFSGETQYFRTPQPRLLDIVPVENAQDVQILGREHFLVTSFPPVGSLDEGATLVDKVGRIDAYRFRTEDGELMTPVLESSTPTRGRPRAILVICDHVFIANEWIGAIASVEPRLRFVPQSALLDEIDENSFIVGDYQIQAPPGSLAASLGAGDPEPVFAIIDLIDAAFPQIPSNLQVLDFTKPAEPTDLGLEYVNRASTGTARWNPNTIANVVAETNHGVAVLNFGENIQIFGGFTALLPRGFLGPVAGITEFSGRCGGGPFGELCIGTNNPLDYLRAQPCEGVGCEWVTEYSDVVFFRDYAIVSEFNALRAISTAVLSSGIEPVNPPEPRLLDYLGSLGAQRGRIHGVERYQWAGQGDEPDDLIFLARWGERLSVMRFESGVIEELGTFPAAEAEFQEGEHLAFGSMSSDSCRGLLYVLGPLGRMGILDIVEPSEPLQLNDSGDLEAFPPFAISGFNSRVPKRGVANQDGVVFVVGEQGVAVVDVNGCTALVDSCAEESDPVRTCRNDGTPMIPALALRVNGHSRGPVYAQAGESLTVSVGLSGQATCPVRGELDLGDGRTPIEINENQSISVVFSTPGVYTPRATIGCENCSVRAAHEIIVYSVEILNPVDSNKDGRVNDPEEDSLDGRGSEFTYWDPNKRFFGGSRKNSALLEIGCEAGIAPRGIADHLDPYLEWTVLDGGVNGAPFAPPDAVVEWDGTPERSGVGSTPKFTVRPMPASNSAFGRKTVRLRILDPRNGDSVLSEYYQPIEIFWPKLVDYTVSGQKAGDDNLARSHPGSDRNAGTGDLGGKPAAARSPNWFFYWAQAIAGHEGGLDNSEWLYGGPASAFRAGPNDTTLPNGVTPGVRFFPDGYSGPAGRILVFTVVGALEKPVDGLTGIDFMRNTVLHELVHVRQIVDYTRLLGLDVTESSNVTNSFWSFNINGPGVPLSNGRNFNHASFDTDANDIPDHLESGIRQKAGLAPTAAVDVETEPKACETVEKGALAPLDWGNPGKNHRSGRFDD